MAVGGRQNEGMDGWVKEELGEERPSDKSTRLGERGKYKGMNKRDKLSAAARCIRNPNQFPGGGKHIKQGMSDGKKGVYRIAAVEGWVQKGVYRRGDRLSRLCELRWPYDDCRGEQREHTQRGNMDGWTGGA